jgi:hypothetical protein
MNDAIKNTLDGDRYFINSHAATDQYVIKNVDDGPPEPMFGSFLLDVDEIERTDGYNTGAQMTFDPGGETVEHGSEHEFAASRNKSLQPAKSQNLYFQVDEYGHRNQ